MLHLLCQTYPSSQPAGGFASFTASDWALIIGAIGALITGVIAAWRRAGDAKETAHDAKADAAEAIGMNTATQQSITRMSTRQNETARLVTGVALKVDPNAKPPETEKP